MKGKYVFKVGYFHSSSEYVPLGFILADNEKQAISKISIKMREYIDGLAEVRAQKVHKLTDIMTQECIDRLVCKEGEDETFKK